MSPKKPFQLTKTRFMLGTECSLALYYDVHAPELLGPPDAMALDLMRQGIEVHNFARHLFRSGVVEIFWESMTKEEAAEQTLAALEDPYTEVIYEASFLLEGEHFRVDILRRNEAGEWEAVEVKASTSVKPEHIVDLAFQYHSLEGVLRLAGAQLVLLNRDYVYQGGAIDPWEIFKFEDVTTEVVELQDTIRAQREAQERMLSNPEPPQVDPGTGCKKPKECPYHSFHDLLPKLEDGTPVHISQLAYLKAGSKKDLAFRERGVTRIDEIPEDMVPLLASSKYQLRQYHGVMTDEVWVEEELLRDFSE